MALAKTQEVMRAVMRLLAMFVCGLTLVPAAARAACNPVPGAESLLRPGRVLLLGEIHGTVEAPRAVEDLVCAALQADLEVAVGLEIPVSEEAAAHRFLQSGGTVEDMAAAIAGEFWQRDYQDGRASKAMQDLLGRLRSHQSARLQLFYIDNPAAPEGRDRFMASRVVATSKAQPAAVVIVLTGDVHNRLTVGTRFDADYEPMGFHVRESLPDAEVVSLRLTHSGGTAWVCAPDCGVLELTGGPGKIGVELQSAVDAAYDGRFHVGLIQASLPAKDR